MPQELVIAPSVKGDIVVPSRYRQDALDVVCQGIIDGEKTLRDLCKPRNMPSVTMVKRWLATSPQFKEDYIDASRIKALMDAGEMVSIADNDDGDVRRDKLRIDTRKWQAEKLLPDTFGSKVEVNLGLSGDLADLILSANQGHVLPSSEVIEGELIED